jgi:pimeloyl-ACP methyl ester carboxylesterase
MRPTAHQIPGLVLVDHRFALPLDHTDPSKGRITVFAREVRAPGRDKEKIPWLVFFQGGPGFASPRPTGSSGWIKRAVREFRVLLLDQRGTGLSSRIDAGALAALGSAENIAAYLRHFRADSIVADAEEIRKSIGGDAPWTALGQSFGGFCVTHYLSIAPEGLSTALITGGLPPLTASADEIYRATYRRVLSRNRRYFERYPEDRETVQRLVLHLRDHETHLPGGGRLTRRKLQQLGFAFGMSDGFETVHYLLEEAFGDELSGGQVSYPFLRGVENQLPFEMHPLYVILHEACYAQESATLWSAERIRSEFPELDADDPFLFNGEMVFPWMLQEYPRLRPLEEAAHILAQDRDWMRLYDAKRLAENRVPASAVIYHDDMYVERAFSEETADAIRGMRAWVTNEYDHNGLRADGERILDRLLAMARGE